MIAKYGDGIRTNRPGVCVCVVVSGSGYYDSPSE
jgi:hypothetical protein